MSDFTSTRITEKRYYAIPPLALTANGTSEGLITISNTYCFKVGQVVLFKQAGTGIKRAKIQRITSETEFIVIEANEPIITKSKLDMSAFSIGDTVELLESKRPVIDLHEIWRQVYEEEPTVAVRSHLVDWLGRSYDTTNPMPVQLSDGSIDIGTVNAELEVQLSHRDNYPDAGDIHDSVRIGGASGYEADVTSTNRLKVDTVISPPDPNDNPKDAIMCADDVHVDYTWQEINGVRRITQIMWSSASVATDLGITSASVQRDYTYQGADPYDLIDRDDSIVLVP
jgi:hypothetical protein